MHQANQKGNSMGLLMPMYTFGIVAFFVYTIMKVIIEIGRRKSWRARKICLIIYKLTKNMFRNLFFQLKLQLVMRKSDNLNPYPPPKEEGNFKQEVFRRDNSKIPNLGTLFPYTIIHKLIIKINNCCFCHFWTTKNMQNGNITIQVSSIRIDILVLNLFQFPYFWFFFFVVVVVISSLLSSF